MLFNSFPFLLGFLPLTLAGYQLAARFGKARMAIAWLTTASLAFYAWWHPPYIAFLVASILLNYLVGLRLLRRDGGRLWLWAGIAANLALLGAFKYLGFFGDSISAIGGFGWHVKGLVLPLGISFFTFQQISYLADVFSGRARETSLVRYCLFISFFPQVIAGPIVYHREMMPQFEPGRVKGLVAENLAVGATIFIFGLGEKVLLADSVGNYSDAVFGAAARGEALGMLEAWAGTVAYTLQIYFDFSGYSDMAIGLAWMVGIRLPLNFDSPYRSASIIEFWRRWHITLSRFIRDRIYLPLGGSRVGTLRRDLNLLVAMLLAGLWHGAGWTFVAWGGFHGLLLAINHRLRETGQRRGLWKVLGRLAGRPGTLVVVMLLWVFFRAEGFSAAAKVFSGMSGMNGWGTSEVFGLPELAFISLAGVVATALPNVSELVGRFSPALRTERPLPSHNLLRVTWRPSTRWAAATAAVAFASLFMIFTRVGPVEFIYFQF